MSPNSIRLTHILYASRKFLLENLKGLAQTVSEIISIQYASPPFLYKLRAFLARSLNVFKFFISV